LICTVCQGEKQTVMLRKIDVRVPPGVKNGSKVRVAKEGGQGTNGGEPGDLFMVICLVETRQLKVDGLTVSCEIAVSIPEAVLGAEIEVPTLHGKVKMIVPPQTSSGTQFRLKGQGASLNGSTGDQYVTIQIVSPKTLSDRERELYEELKRIQYNP
jgi:molecular chaperone DnaJ